MVSDTADHPNDAKLLAAYVADGDQAAFGQLIARHHAAVARHALRLTGNHAGAEDVTQATFSVLARRPAAALRTARRRGDVFPWLGKTCRFTASNWRRSRHRRQKHEARAAVPHVMADLSRPTELAEMVAVAMGDLRRRDRRLVELRHLDELSWAEVAERLSTTPDAARMACEGALAKLRAALARRSITVMPAVLVSTLAYLAKPTKAAAPSATAFSLATGVITMMKLKTAGVVAGFLLLTSSVALIPALAQDAGNASTGAASQPATQATTSPNVQLASVSLDDVIRVPLEGPFELQITNVLRFRDDGSGKTGLLIGQWTPSGHGEDGPTSFYPFDRYSVAMSYRIVRKQDAGELLDVFPSGVYATSEQSIGAYNSGQLWLASPPDHFEEDDSPLWVQDVIRVSSGENNVVDLKIYFNKGNWERVLSCDYGSMATTGSLKYGDLDSRLILMTPKQDEDRLSTQAVVSVSFPPIALPTRVVGELFDGSVVLPQRVQLFQSKEGTQALASFAERGNEIKTVHFEVASNIHKATVKVPTAPGVDLTDSPVSIEKLTDADIVIWPNFKTEKASVVLSLDGSDDRFERFRRQAKDATEFLEKVHAWRRDDGQRLPGRDELSEPGDAVDGR